VEGGIVRLVLDRMTVVRDRFSLIADGTFSEGIHLVSGDVGSGKSTLAFAMMGLMSCESGSVSRDRIGSAMLSFQFPGYHITGMTLEEEGLSWGVPWEECFSSSGFRTKRDQSPFSLSRGELAQFYLSCFLRRHDDLLLLDEPFGSLDCESKKKLCDRLSHRTTGITIIFTHERTFLPRVTRIWEISDGKLFDRGMVPGAIRQWHGAPSLIKNLIREEKIPNNISYDDILEAVCRT
jgi:energy-coupling factor transport system ATP-binding protein